MSRELFSPNKDVVVTIPEPIELGGTSATTSAAACQNLNMLSNVELDQVNGAAQLDANSLIKSANLPILDISPIPTVSGNTTVYTGQVCKFHITNYDSLRTYDLTAISGTVSLVTYENFNQCMLTNGGTENSELPGAVTVCDKAGTIIFTAPNNPGPSGFTLNGVAYEFTVLAAFVAKPVLLSPTNNETWNRQILTALVAQPIVMGHETSTFSWDIEFQLAEDNAFTLNPQTSTVTTLSTLFNNLTVNKLYYVRVRAQVPDTYAYSEWSNVISFVTEQYFIPSGEVQILMADTPVSNDWFGWGVDITGDGSRIVVGASGDDSDTGTAYVFTRSGNSWSQEAKLVDSTRQLLDGFGVYVSISDDGNYIAIGTKHDHITTLNDNAGGAVFIFKRTGTDWAQEAKIILADVIATGRSDASVSLNADGSKLIIGSQFVTGSVVSCGAAYIYTRTGTLWSQDIKLSASDEATGAQFGRRVTMNAAGDRVFVSATSAQDTSMTKSIGKVYVYHYNGSAWIEEAILADDTLSNGAFFGSEVATNTNTDIIAIGASWEDSGGQPDSGAVYIFTRSGTVWTQAAKLIDNVSNPYSKQFGSSVAFNATGDQLIIGACENDNGNNILSGVVYIYRKVNDVWTKLKTVKPSNAQAGMLFGEFLACNNDGTIMVIGAEYFNMTPQIIDNGAAFIFM